MSNCFLNNQKVKPFSKPPDSAAKYTLVGFRFKDIMFFSEWAKLVPHLYKIRGQNEGT